MPVNHKNLIVFSSVAIVIIGTSFALVFNQYVEENGPITYMKYSYQNGTGTIVCDKTPLMPPFNCEIQKP